MAARSPLVVKAVSYVLIGFGATLIISGVVNIVAAWQLIEPAEEQSLGVTRQQIVGWFSLLLVAGLTLVVLGVRRFKSVGKTPPIIGSGSQTHS
jgi:hypothetical protein